MTDPDTIPCPPSCELCGYDLDDCSCADCATGDNVVLLNALEHEGDA